LRLLGIDHVVFEPEINEDNPPGAPAHMVREFAERKAEAAAGFFDVQLILAADTAVVLDDVVMGKPRTAEEAADMLRRLSGKWHRVHTGIALRSAATEGSLVGEEVTDVRFRDLDETEVHDYILTGEPFDKAGAYGIQGRASAMVERIEGCYFNVVGLPVVRCLALMRELGYGYGYDGLYPIGRSGGAIG
jgi:septum formation protein